MGTDNKPVKPNGMPDMAPDEKSKDGCRFYATPIIAALVRVHSNMTISLHCKRSPSACSSHTFNKVCAPVQATLLIGAGIAFAIFTFGSKDKYLTAIEAVRVAELQWVYLAVVVFGRTILFVNFYPMGWKGKIMRGSSGNLRSVRGIRLRSLDQLLTSSPSMP